MMSANPYDYHNRQGITPISWMDFHGLCKGLVQAIAPWQPEIVLVTSRGGYYPGTLIAHMLRIEVYPVRLSRRVQDIVTYEQPQWSIWPPDAVKGKRVLIVDEISSTGETLAIVKAETEQRGAAGVRTAVLYAHTRGADTPDYIGLMSDNLLLNPWDREVFEDGHFQMHPEYAGALQQQGVDPDSTLLIQTSIIPPIKKPSA